MDPFTHNLLGQIRQQELLEQIAQGKLDSRRWRWNLISGYIDVWKREDEDATAQPVNGQPLLHRLRQLVTRLLGQQGQHRAPAFAAQEASVSDCIAEC